MHQHQPRNGNSASDRSSAADTNPTAPGSSSESASDSEAIPAMTSPNHDLDGNQINTTNTAVQPTVCVSVSVFGEATAPAQEEDAEEKPSPSQSEEEGGGDMLSQSTNENNASNDSEIFSSDHSAEVAEAPSISFCENAAPPVASNGVQIRIIDATSPPAGAGTAAAAQEDNTEHYLTPSEGCGDIAVDMRQSVPIQYRKDRPPEVTEGSDTGAMHVDEQAPQLNRRFYLGLDRPSVLLRNNRAREARAAARRRRRSAAAGGNDGGDQRQSRTEGDGDGEEEAQSWRRSSPMIRSIAAMIAHVTLSPTSQNGVGPTTDAEAPMTPDGEHLISAILVEEEEPGEVVVAEPVSYFARKWKVLACAMCLAMVAMAVFLSINVVSQQNEANRTDLPSMQPSSPPTFDTRPTLQVVQERGFVRCGLRKQAIESREGLMVDLCRAIAAVLFGNPENFEGVPATFSSRFHQLRDRDVDLMLYGDAYTIEREIKERTSGVGFTFSSPYFYSGLAYYGNETYVKCAEEENRYDECASLHICVADNTTILDYVQSSFPTSFFSVSPSYDDSVNSLLNESCNVLASGTTLLADFPPHLRKSYVKGDRLLTKEPLAIVTRKDDREFSDIINWVVQALFYGQEQGLTKNSSLCHEYKNLTSRNGSDLYFLDSVHCVGNYGEIYHRAGFEGEINRINNGTTGMMYAIPFGDLSNGDDVNVAEDVIFQKISQNKLLNCGVVVPEDFDGDLDNSRELIGMSVSYCHVLAAALFNGKWKAVNLLPFLDANDSPYDALNNGTIDVLAGGRIQTKHDFPDSPSQRGGFHFSTPYFYGNETADDYVSFFALATREDDIYFSSFVNCVVSATIHAQEESITKKRGKEMPLLSMFGSEMKWALRDAISYSGSYDEIYATNFQGAYVKQIATQVIGKGVQAAANGTCRAEDLNTLLQESSRGRNDLNEGGPQIHSFPGLFREH